MLLNETHSRVVAVVMINDLHCFLGSIEFSLCFQLLFYRGLCANGSACGSASGSAAARAHQLLAYVGRAGACAAAARAAGDV